MFGDSITERLRGTCKGNPQSDAIRDGLPEFVDTEIRQHWPRLQLHGICGETADELLWRLRVGGELSQRMADDSRLLISLLIGINGTHLACLSAPLPARMSRPLRVTGSLPSGAAQISARARRQGRRMRPSSPLLDIFYRARLAGS